MGHVKDEGKKMDPLFPRLHITDADKGGPRTPPRNKMALSQQLNAPSQRCIPGSVPPMLPLSTNNGSSLVPATSSYHDARYKRSVFSSFGSSCGSARLATRLDSYHSGGINLNISLTTVKQTIEATNCQTLCNAGHLKPGDYCLFKPQGFANTKNHLVKKLEDEEDYLVTSLPFGKGAHSTNRGKPATLSTNPHVKHQITCQKQLKPADSDATQESKLDATLSNDIGNEPTSYYSDRVRFSETISGGLSPSNPRKRSILVDEPQMLQDSNIRLQLKKRILQENMAYRDGILAEPENAARKTSTSTWPLLGVDHKTDKGTHEVLAPTHKIEEEDCGSLQLGDMGNTGDILEANSVSGFKITPEEVSQMIGAEQFCEARRTIVQQQRVFQSQLFELHRLIKVQKLLAGSPDLLLEDSFYVLKKTPSEELSPKVDCQERESCLQLRIDSMTRKPFHTNNDTDKRYTQPSNCNPNSVSLPPPSAINGAKQPPWCFLPPPGNQWLVPVRSPSEGLVYKPCTGPSPLPVGFMAPIYGMGLTPSNGGFLNEAYNLATSYQQGIGIPPGTSLYTPYGFPITKASCSSTNEESIACSKPVKTSCHILIPEKWTLSGEAQTLHDNKESDLQGSSGSGSYERKKGGDELPLFPTTPVFQDSDQCTEEKGSNEKIKAIKVVPHNPKLASESAARIFQFIQEERKQYD